MKSHRHENCRPHKRRHHDKIRDHFKHKEKRMFAMKRPLRFLVHKLDLDDDQAMVIADAMNAYRIEKAQYEVDKSRSQQTLFEAIKSEPFDDDQAQCAIEAAANAVTARETAFAAALKQIHGALDAEQREKFAVLIAGVGFKL